VYPWDWIKPHRHPTDARGAYPVASAPEQTAVRPDRNWQKDASGNHVAARQESRQPPDHDQKQIDHSFPPVRQWFLLPNTPLVKKTRCLLFVGFGRLFGPPKTLYFHPPQS
jgi:hypothetical protein